MDNAPHAGHRERLRARFAKEGSDGFADHELLELLLTYTIPRRDTNALAHALLSRFGSLAAVFDAEVPQLMGIPGVGEQTAIFLRLQRCLARRMRQRALNGKNGRPLLNSPCAAAEYALSILSGNAYETVRLVCLNARREVIRDETMQLGSLTEAQIYPRRIAEAALLQRAHSALLIHNHPSGSPVPSDGDVSVTKALQSALSALDIQLADHLVVGDGCVYSFAADRIIDLSGETPTSFSVQDWTDVCHARRAGALRVMEPYALPR